MAPPARIRIALAVVLLLMLGAAWLAFSSGSRNSPQIPPADPTAPAANPVAETRLEASDSTPEPSRATTRAEPTEHAALPAPGTRALARTPTPPRAPIEGDRLLFTVLDPSSRPVTALERIELEYASKDLPAKFIASLASADGMFECAMGPCRGTIRVHSTRFGDASTVFVAPENGVSHAAMTLSAYASILGRVEHGGRAVPGATVCIETLTRFPATAVEAVLGCSSSPYLHCRHVLGSEETDSDGGFAFAVEGPGEYVLVARRAPEGAVTTDPIVVAGTREARPLVLELSPASSAEVRWTGSPDPGVAVPFTAWGENGLRIDSRVTPPELVMTFSCLPAGTYEIPRPFESLDGAAAQFEVDGAAHTLVRRELSTSPGAELVLTCPANGKHVEARLYRIGCCVALASDCKLGDEPAALEVGDPGMHVLVLEEFGMYGRTAYRRLITLTAASGRNELALRAIELPGELICTSQRALPPNLHARFSLEDGSVMFVPLDRDARSSREKLVKPPAKERVNDAVAASTPLGKCDLVYLDRSELVLLQAGVEIASGVPTIIRL